MVRNFWTVLALFVLMAAPAQTLGGDPKDATAWFARARGMFNLREQGAAPFHLRASFHAYPGLEVQKRTEIISGDGTYDEIWLAPHQWRREVSLGEYHAVEAQSGPERRMEASSEYEPSRVLMLMEALLDPVPRNLIEPQLNDVPLAWKIEHRSAKDLSFVRLSRTWVSGQRSFAFGYLFLPGGLLVQSDQAGLVTGWQDELAFGGKAVPRRITVLAGQRPLLSVDVAVEASGDVGTSAFELSGPIAEPGVTLRPLHPYETHGPELLDGSFSYIARSTPPYVMRQIIDRHGKGRELEVIAAPPNADLSGPADGFRHIQWRAAVIDRSPCEIAHAWYY